MAFRCSSGGCCRALGPRPVRGVRIAQQQTYPRFRPCLYIALMSRVEALMQTTRVEDKAEILSLLKRAVHLARGWPDERLAPLLRRAIIRVRLQKMRDRR